MNVQNDQSNGFHLSVEPVLFSFIFTLTLSNGVVTNLLLRQACWYEGVTLDQCIGDAQISAQQTVSHLETIKMIIECVLPIILSFFIGPWSDTNGRRFLLIVPVAGYAFTYCCWGILSTVRGLHPGYFLFCSLGIAFTGGMVTISIGSFCYLADITEAKDRVFRMGIAEGAINGAQLLGYFLSPYLFGLSKEGYWVVFLTDAIILLLNLIYIICFIPETIEKLPDRNQKLFQFDHLKNAYLTVFKKRTNFGRPIILLTIFASFLNLLTIFGETGIKYMSVMKAFHWELKNYTLYNTICLGILFVTASFGLWIGSSLLKIPITILLLFAYSTKVVSGFLMGISTTPEFFYIATLFGSIRGFINPLVRSQIALIVPQTDVGKIYSFMSSIEFLTPLIAVPLYCTVYALLVGSSPLDIYFITCAFYSVGVFIIIVIMVLNRISKNSESTQPVKENIEP